MDHLRPTCPTCGTADERSPDAFGVHRCPACAIEFRPRVRMPIRRARVVRQDHAQTFGWVISLMLIATMVMLAMAYGDHQASMRPPAPPVIEPFVAPIVVPTYDPLEHLDALQFEGPLTRIPLPHELHVKQLANGELFATGLITTSEPVEAISVEAECRDLAGASLGTFDAVVSCTAMQPGERCAWMVESKIASPVAEIEFKPRARRALGLEPPQLDLRSDRPDELRFEPKQRQVRFVLRERTLSDAWATVTAYSPQGRVLGVAMTRYSGRHRPGRHRFEVALPKPPDEVGFYEARLGGQLSEW